MSKNLDNEYTEETMYQTALYVRLSREDGDKTESFSIGNQKLLLMDFISKHKDLCVYDFYIDDGFTGTTFNRPDFQRMIADIESKKIQCVVVKDLSRLGRNMPKVTEYISEYFPSKKVRFIAINDNIDKQYYDMDSSEDMAIDIKNLFNGFYPKDISKKVRSTFRTKQSKGEFIGAFACFGYMKSPTDHNKIIIDEYAASIVRRIYQMYLSGMGQMTIAKKLNDEGIPCPSEYKKQCGLNYHNSTRLDYTTYWTYSTIRAILKNEIYIGNMVQNKTFRQICKKTAITLPKEKWIIVENTHEAIIDKETWDKVQSLLERNTRQTGLTQNIHIFAGFLKCGDCGRAMVKIKRSQGICFNCGSYNRYGKNANCTIHSITEKQLESIVLKDLNSIIGSLQNLQELIRKEQIAEMNHRKQLLTDTKQYELELEKYRQKRMKAYNDYNDDLLSREDYLTFKSNCEKQEQLLMQKLQIAQEAANSNTLPNNEWIEKLLSMGHIERLDRDIIVNMIDMIHIYENHTVKIIYNFSDELDALLRTL